MKKNLELLIMIIYTTHALPINYPAKEAQNDRKDSADSTPKSPSLSDQSLKQLRLNFLTDPSSEIKMLNNTGRSRVEDTPKVMKLTDSQIREIKENYNTNMTNIEIKLPEKETEEINSVHRGTLGRSKNHDEHTSDIYVWSSNALTEEQWETIQNNVKENETEIKIVNDETELVNEKYDNHPSKNADGRHRIEKANNVIEKPKYYSFSNSEWEELKKTLHEHLTGEDEKILKINEDQSGRNRNEKVKSSNPPKWSIWSSYALKPSEWDQLKQNIHHNELIMNSTQNNISPVGRGRSNEGDLSIKGYDMPSTNDHINAVIVKPVTGERLYNLRKTFDWDGLLESISSKDINATDEGKDVNSIVDGTDGYNNQSNDKNENPINESQTGRNRKIGRQRQVIGIMPSLVLDDENIPNYEDIGSGPLFIEKDTTVGVDENNTDSNESTIISIQENDLNIQNTEKTAINFGSETPDSELKDNINTFTPIYLTEDTSITEKYVTESGGNENTTRENIQNTEKTAINFVSGTPVSELKDNENTFTPSIYLTEDTSISEKYVTESGGNDNTTRENYIFQQSVVSANSLSIKPYDTTDSENYNTTELPDFYNSTRENYIKIKPVSDSTEIIDFSTLIQNKDSNIHDTNIINDTFTINSLNIDLTEYTNYNHATEQDYSMNNNESEYTLINDNTTTEVFIINLSDNDVVVSTAKVMYFDENENGLYHSSTTSQGNKMTTSTNDPIYIIDTDSNNELKNASFVNLSEVTTEDKVTLITETLSPDPLNIISDSLVDNYNSHLIENDTSTVSQEYKSTTEGESFGLFDFFGMFDKSKSKTTTMSGFNDFAVNESTITVINPSTTTDSSLSVIIDDDDDGYVAKEIRFDIPEDILITTEELLGNNDTSIILEKETSLKNKDPTLSSSDAIMMDEEIIIFTTDHMDISEYYSTTSSEELAAVLSNSDPVPTSKFNAGDLGEMVSSDLMITTVEISAEETSSSDDDNLTENPKNEKEILDITIIPSADVSENMSIKSSEILSTTQDMEPNEVEIYPATEKLQNEVPNQPQELVGNEIPNISTTARPTTVELTPVEPVSNIMPTWIILLIVLILSLIVIAVGFVIVLRIKRQTGHVQLSP